MTPLQIGQAVAYGFDQAGQLAPALAWVTALTPTGEVAQLLYIPQAVGAPLWVDDPPECNPTAPQAGCWWRL